MEWWHLLSTIIINTCWPWTPDYPHWESRPWICTHSHTFKTNIWIVLHCCIFYGCEFLTVSHFKQNEFDRAKQLFLLCKIFLFIWEGGPLVVHRKATRWPLVKGFKPLFRWITDIRWLGATPQLMTRGWEIRTLWGIPPTLLYFRVLKFWISNYANIIADSICILSYVWQYQCGPLALLEVSWGNLIASRIP